MLSSPKADSAARLLRTAFPNARLPQLLARQPHSCDSRIPYTRAAALFFALLHRLAFAAARSAEKGLLDSFFRLLQFIWHCHVLLANYFRLLRFVSTFFQFPVNYLRLLQPAQSNFLFRDNYLRFPLLCNLMLRPGNHREHPQTRNSGQLSIIFCTRDLWRAPRASPEAPQHTPRSPPALRNRSKRK